MAHFSRLPVKSLLIFSVVARQGSFKQAAKHLCVTAQAISQQMKGLEQQLQLQVFERLPAGIALTPAGERLLDYSERAFGLLEQGVNIAKACQHRRALRLNVSPWFAVHRLLARLPEFEALHPELDVQVSISSAFPDFQQQRLDGAIQWGWGQWPGRRHQLLLQDDKRLVIAPALQQRQPVHSVADLARHKLLCTSLSVQLWQKLATTLGLALAVEQQALVLDSQASQVEAALQGLGIALLSDRVALDACAGGQLLMPLWQAPVSAINPALLPGYWWVIDEDAPPDPVVEQFQHWLAHSLLEQPEGEAVCGT